MSAFLGAAAAGIPAAVVTSAPWWALVLMPLGGAVGAFAPELVRDRAELDERRARVHELWEAPARPSLADLLRPERAAVEFVGRSAELAELTRWAEAPEAEPLYLMVGPGGVGKSRLTVEFTARMSARGWSAHWIRDGQEATALSTTRAVHRRTPLLLVVDYAEIRVGLAALLHELAVTLGAGESGSQNTARARAGQVRVLLIARADGEWWQRLAAGEAAARAMVRRAGILRIGTELAADLDPAELVAQAAARFAALLETSVPDGWQVEVPEGARVLELHAAALVVVLRARGRERRDAADADAIRLVADVGVLDTLIEHESRLWLHSLPEPLTAAGERGARRIVTAVALVSVHDESEAVAVLSRVPELADPWRATVAARWARELYPPQSPDMWCGAPAPDLLAERVAVRTLFESAGLATALIAPGAAQQVAEALTVLTRAGQHHEDAEALLEEVLSADPSRMTAPAMTVAVQTGGVIGSVLAHVLAHAPLGADESDRIARAIPFPSLALGTAAAVVSGRAVQELSQQADPAERARRLHQWSKALYQAGDPVQAATVQEQAVDLLRRLDEAEPGTNRSLLAAALNNLGVWYSATGELGKALDAAVAAVGMRRELASADAEQQAALAAALVNLAVRYSHNREPDKSLNPGREAVELLTALDEREQGAHRPDLATAWSNYGEYLSEAGAAQEAASATARALALRRALVAEDPDRYQPVLLTSLLNHGDHCSAVGRWREAVASMCEAVLLGLRLERYGHHVNLASLAMALSGLADLAENPAALDTVATELAALPARLHDPIALTQEAARYWHLLSEPEMLVYRHRATTTLHQLARRLAAAGRMAESEQAAAEASRIDPNSNAGPANSRSQQIQTST